MRSKATIRMFLVSGDLLEQAHGSISNWANPDSSVKNKPLQAAKVKKLSHQFWTPVLSSAGSK